MRVVILNVELYVVHFFFFFIFALGSLFLPEPFLGFVSVSSLCFFLQQIRPHYLEDRHTLGLVVEWSESASKLLFVVCCFPLVGCAHG